MSVCTLSSRMQWHVALAAGHHFFEFVTELWKNCTHKIQKMLVRLSETVLFEHIQNSWRRQPEQEGLRRCTMYLSICRAKFKEQF